MKFKTLYITSILFSVLFLMGCKDMKNAKTTIEIVDNDRHYYPILRGQDLDIVFPIKNTGEEPFILSDIISTCGCISLNNSSIKNIPAGKEGRLHLKYNSRKNIGYVQHHITLYGNFTTTDKIDLAFDVHVVPSALYTKDYEELFHEENEKMGGVKELVDGNENQKGYYLNGDF